MRPDRSIVQSVFDRARTIERAAHVRCNPQGALMCRCPPACARPICAPHAARRGPRPPRCVRCVPSSCLPPRPRGRNSRETEAAASSFPLPPLSLPIVPLLYTLSLHFVFTPRIPPSNRPHSALNSASFRPHSVLNSRSIHARSHTRCHALNGSARRGERRIPPRELAYARARLFADVRVRETLLIGTARNRRAPRACASRRGHLDVVRSGPALQRASIGPFRPLSP